MDKNDIHFSKMVNNVSSWQRMKQDKIFMYHLISALTTVRNFCWRYHWQKWYDPPYNSSKVSW